MSKLLIALVIPLALAGCASLPTPGCPGGAARALQDTLYFGTATPTGVVTPEQWAGFLRDTVAPRFPQGLTVWQAAGQWRGADGGIVREASQVLTLIHPDDAGSETAVREIVADYKARFQQEAVLRVRAEVCPSF